MKELLLLRHAKSSWSNPHLDDFDRPLNTRGQRDAPHIADWISKHHRIDRLLCSPSKRTTLTAKYIREKIQIPDQNYRLEPTIYLASKSTLLDMIMGTQPTVNHLMIVAHNPGITDIANHFLGKKIENIPTAGFLSLVFNIDEWSECSSNNLIHHSFITPKTIKEQP